MTRYNKVPTLFFVMGYCVSTLFSISIVILSPEFRVYNFTHVFKNEQKVCPSVLEVLTVLNII
jgi:hypothetical protein